jgi:hypothetical protein
VSFVPAVAVGVQSIFFMSSQASRLYLLLLRMYKSWRTERTMVELFPHEKLGEGMRIYGTLSVRQYSGCMWVTSYLRLQQVAAVARRWLHRKSHMFVSNRPSRDNVSQVFA